MTSLDPNFYFIFSFAYHHEARISIRPFTQFEDNSNLWLNSRRSNFKCYYFPTPQGLSEMKLVYKINLLQLLEANTEQSFRFGSLSSGKTSCM